ncbi:sensor histidine kinase [Agromyces larvae]|uniref:histidine kinase n=1 Tax=Agromyces larvae TaxID=2929802 RepID=A0ABY4BWK7_9MICO|nr:HAMP domain-containing sensor histidine kinase [Agromyces larvae]UOE43617.1 HAMP domain-containing histidine kinase [Agromyces larvae]
MTDPSPAPPRRRWSFRTRLTVTIAAIFVAAGVGLLAVQYLLVQSFFRAASTTTICSEVKGPDASGPATSANCFVMTGTALGDADHPPPGAAITRETLEAAFDEYSGALSQDVLGSLLIASVVVIVVFAVIAVLLAGWLARRSLRRIAEVTELTRRITTDDLDRRLDLAGPDDEIKELGDTIDDMLDRLHTAFEAQDRFVQNASHELRTPLTVTRAALEIPLEQGRVPAELQPAMRRALAANAHSERLIGSLLVLARGRGRLDERVPVELGPLLATVVAEAAGEAGAHGVEVSFDPPATSVTVDGDEQLLALAARNLVDNAVRYNDERGVVQVRIDAERPGFTIENTGRELGDTEIAALGEPFHRGEASRRADRDGYGLGLSIVRAVAAAHGGDLVLSPRPGGGLIATLTLAGH